MPSHHSSSDNKEKKKQTAKLQLASGVDASIDDVPLEVASSSNGNIRQLEGNTVAPGAFATSDHRMAPSRGETNIDGISVINKGRDSSAGSSIKNTQQLRLASAAPSSPSATNTTMSTKATNNEKIRLAPATSVSLDAAGVDHTIDGNASAAAQTSLVQAQIAEDVDVEALVDERIQQMDVGLVATVRVDGDDDDDDDAPEDRREKNTKLSLIIVVGVLVIAGAAAAGVVLSRPSSNDVVPGPINTDSPTPIPGTPPPTIAPTIASRSDKVQAILAALEPWNDAAITWLVDFDDWEPVSGDPNGDYLWLERYAMAELYYTTNGPSWTRKDNWLSGLPVCSWYFGDGSSSTNECAGGGGGAPIQKLFLYNNQLTSSIPASIGSLTLLTSFNLGMNQLTSSIPSSIQNLTLLKDFRLFSNQLTSNIPSSIWALTELTTLVLARNQFTSSIPASIENLTQLELLNLRGNQLTSNIPSSIGSLTKLSYLAMYDNQLSGSIPPSIFNLEALEFLYLHNNKLTGSIPNLPLSLPGSQCCLAENDYQNIFNGLRRGCVTGRDCPS